MVYETGGEGRWSGSGVMFVSCHVVRQLLVRRHMISSRAILSCYEFRAIYKLTINQTA